jgi:hypothetical protein
MRGVKSVHGNDAEMGTNIVVFAAHWPATLPACKEFAAEHPVTIRVPGIGIASNHSPTSVFAFTSLRVDPLTKQTNAVWLI